MKVDCQWFSTNIEAFFCDGLDARQLRLASDHLSSCQNCRDEVQALRDVDPLVKQLFQYRMAKAIAGAHAPKRSLGFQIGLAGAAVVLAGILVVAVLLHRTDGPDHQLPANPTSVQNSEPPATNDSKTEDVLPSSRAKPDAPTPNSKETKPGPEPVITENSPAFLVTDASGYSTSLADYRGRVLLFGVWSAEQPDGAQNIQKLYQSFGNRKEVRILGVTSRGEARPVGMTFPMVFNNGSRLLDARTSDYVVVDKEGTVQMRGSLAGDPNVLTAKIKAKLDELGGR